MLDLALSSTLGSEWVSPGDAMSLARKGKSAIPTRGQAPGWDFLPPVPQENYFESFALFQVATARASVNGHYAAATLVDIGEPALLALEAWRGAPDLRAVRDYVESAVTLPSRRPVPFEGGTARDRMMARVLLEDLMAGYPYQGGYRLAGHVLTDLWIAGQYMPLLGQAAQSENPFVCRNAIYTLASLAYVREGEACRILLETVKNRRDAVCWYRAARILTDARDPRIGDVLAGALPGKDPVAASFMLRMIGQLRHGPASAALLKTSLAFDADLDVQWAFLEAVCRLPAIELPLRQRAQELADRYAPQESGKPLILRNLAWMALDQAGGTRRIRDLAEKSRDRAQRNLGSVLADFGPSHRGLVIEHLARLNWPSLKEVAQDKREPMSWRQKAVSEGAWTVADADWLLGIADNRKEPLELRAAAAIRRLAVLPARGVPAVILRVDAYAGGFGAPPTTDEERMIDACIASLGKELPTELLAMTLQAAIDVRANNGMKKQSEFVETLLGLLVGRGEAAARPVIEKVLEGKESIYRGNAAFALSHFHSPEAVRRTTELLAHPDPFVRQCAAFGLEKNRKLAFDVDWGQGGEKERASRIREARLKLGLNP